MGATEKATTNMKQIVPSFSFDTLFGNDIFFSHAKKTNVNHIEQSFTNLKSIHKGTIGLVGHSKLAVSEACSDSCLCPGAR
jgi:hypothetical protein